MPSRAQVSTVDDLAAVVEADQSFDSARSINEVLLKSPELLRFLVGTAIRCLGACRCYYDRTSKQMVEIPDGNTQMRAVAFLAAYRDGLPTETSVNVNLGERGSKHGGELTVGEAMAASPALRQKLRDMLDESERKAIKVAEPVKP